MAYIRCTVKGFSLWVWLGDLPEVVSKQHD
jgi:hypothetical protein